MGPRIKYTPTPFAGAFVWEIEPIKDERGFFGYLFDGPDAAKQGFSTDCVQVKLSYNYHKGTLRGMHYQAPPHAEVKLVRCIRGAVWDVIVDLRPDSPTRYKYFGIELSADNHKALYVPQLFAHGYQTLTDNAEVVYQVDEYYAPSHERGLRYDDPGVGITWPVPVTSVAKRDEAWPLIS